MRTMVGERSRIACAAVLAAALLPSCADSPAALADAALEVRIERADSGPPARGYPVVLSTSAGRVLQAETNESGFASFGRVESGPATVRVVPPQTHATVGGESKAVVLEEGITATVSFEVRLRLGTVVVTVRDEEEAPVPGAVVSVHSPVDGSIWWGATAADGRVQTDVHPGTYVVTLASGDYMPRGSRADTIRVADRQKLLYVYHVLPRDGG